MARPLYLESPIGDRSSKQAAKKFLLLSGMNLDWYEQSLSQLKVTAPPLLMLRSNLL